MIDQGEDQIRGLFEQINQKNKEKWKNAGKTSWNPKNGLWGKEGNFIWFDTPEAELFSRALIQEKGQKHHFEINS